MKQGVLSTQLGSLTGSGQLRPRTAKQNCDFSDERKRIEVESGVLGYLTRAYRYKS